MQYNVSTLLKEPVGSTREYEVEGQVLIEHGEPESCAVTGHTTFLRTRHGVLVTAQLHGVQHELCSRCLREMGVPMRVEIEEEFFSSVSVDTGAALPPPEDPEAFRIDAHQTLDLDEAVRQFWTAALPVQPLCRPDCRGLCPRCGQDLNPGPCACPPEEDDRWSALRLLAREMERK